MVSLLIVKQHGVNTFLISESTFLTIGQDYVVEKFPLFQILRKNLRQEKAQITNVGCGRN